MRHSILLVTQDDDVAACVAAALSQYTLLLSKSEEEALDLLADNEVALALIDDAISGYDGRELFASLNLQHPAIAGILLIHTPENEQLRASFEAGFSGVAIKPLKPVHLQKVVRQAFDRITLQAENIQLRTLLPLYKLAEQFLASTDEQGVLDCLLATIEQLTDAKNISIMLYDESSACLRIARAKGLDQGVIKSIRMQPGEQIAGWVFAEGKPVILNKEDQYHSIFAPFLKRNDIVSAISYPLSVRSHILGVLNISLTSSDRRFSEADKEMLSIVTSQAALALENVRALVQVESAVRTRTLLEQFVAPQVAELLINKQADPVDLGEVLRATVLFADIRNFTGLVQHLALDQLRLFLNDFFKIFIDAIFQEQGTIDKFMGDAVLAVFGAPVSMEKPNHAAMRTALIIRQRFHELREKWTVKCDVLASVDLGIGVTCGDVFLGNVGSVQRFDYTVIGHDVNLAQRLAALSSSCSIYVTSRVKENVKDAFVLESRGPTQLRGIEHPLEVFSLKGMKDKGCGKY
ncbi:adenylate/guanylate cyclase domain-containing protein [Desulfogranum japonicum]|uniref:adenylate/guanylate cyclase domain-containing protein n=1 Tax=Desulfogranum japonicum TaxID=231447 RepID=UPI0009FCBC75|nr:adenylate/guanylate cyclase domain-containing protein [Desulfogranum japonicum]